MPASYIRLLPLLEEFELVQVAALSAWYEKRPSIPENTINGYVQFVLVQKANDIDDQKELPVVAVVGSNYYQGPAVKTDCVLPYARHFYNEQVVDRKLKEEMRGPLDFALNACRRNHEAWTAKRFASGKIEFEGDYILVVTNLSPFFTLRKWLDHSERGKLLELWLPETHLRALTSKIGSLVDLWVGHGSGALFGVFPGLADSLKWNHWLLTYNLSGLGLGNMHKAAQNKGYKGRQHALHRLYM